MFWANAIINLFQRAAGGETRERVMSLYTVEMGFLPLGWAFGGTPLVLLTPKLWRA